MSRRIPFLTLMSAACVTACSTAGEPSPAIQPMAEEAIATAHTTRLPAGDPETQAIVLTQAVYAATREENAAGAIILCPQDAVTAFTAMNRITHMPVNAPLLYLDRRGRLSAHTKEEMRRLAPDGVVQDGQVQVYLIGEADPSVAQTIRDELGYKLRHFDENNPVALAELLDRWAAALKSDHPDEVVVSAVDHPDGVAHGIGAMAWNAHRGKGFAWVRTDSVPEETRRILERRSGGAFLYVTGGPDVISNEVAVELARYGLVRRIAGPDPVATNVINAGYKDFGRNVGWWWDWQPRAFGWGISQSGHNFVIGSADDMLGVIPAALLGHMGKHGPTLLVRRDQVPKRVSDYLEMVRPGVTAAHKPIFNYAWIIGDESRIAWSVQAEVDRLLRPTEENLDGRTEQ